MLTTPRKSYSIIDANVMCLLIQNTRQKASPELDHRRALYAAIHGQPRDWRRRRGRPAHTWTRTVEADLKPANIGLFSAWHRATERRIGLLGADSFGQPCPRLGFAPDDDDPLLSSFFLRLNSRLLHFTHCRRTNSSSHTCRCKKRFYRTFHIIFFIKERVFNICFWKVFYFLVAKIFCPAKYAKILLNLQNSCINATFK